jgi:hypothetical protein
MVRAHLSVAVPDVNSIETLLDFDQLMLEDVTGQLKSVQDHK